MVKKNGVLVPIFAFVLGILAVVFSFLAYVKRIKAEDVGPKVNGACIYPNTGACALGITAAAFLLAEQTLISSAISCFCCCGGRISSTCSAVTSLILFVISWLTFVIAFLGLLYTAIHNNISYLAKYHYEDKSHHTCKVGREDLFLGAAIWCIISIVLGLISYAFWSFGATNDTINHGTSANYKQGGVAMGRPHHTQLSKDQY